MARPVRVASIQAKRRTISYKVSTVDEALKQVRADLDELTTLDERVAEMGCHIIAFPEDTLGTLEWEAGLAVNPNKDDLEMRGFDEGTCPYGSNNILRVSV